ncbi:TIR domain-containing protein [Candidatus Gottesmanbacteria bacterium]|nr:TIR domain-containing protein [Candidatus Gottesmanbacteria bacterium]
MYSDFLVKQKAKRVFLSFASEDLDHVRGLRLLKDNPNFDLEFYDESIQEPIDSINSSYIMSVIREQIKRASVTICLISETTHSSDWVDWELRTSEEEGNIIIAMAIKAVEKAILPIFIKGKEIKFWSWNPEFLAELISKT